jgi:hypothetical protein
MGLLHTVAVLAWLPIGYLGAWRVMSIFPSSRARIAGLVVFAAVPLPYSALGAGRWGVVAAYGAAPWVVHLLRKIALIEPALLARSDADVVDAFDTFNRREELYRVARLALLVGFVAAFEPSFLVVVVISGLWLALATVVARGSTRAAITLFAGAAIAAGVALLINLPWVNSLIGTHGWDASSAPPRSRRQTWALLPCSASVLGQATLVCWRLRCGCRPWRRRCWLAVGASHGPLAAVC